MNNSSKLFSLLSIIVLSALLVSCRAKKDATAFASSLESAVRKHDIKAQHLLCPFLGAADSISFSFQPDLLNAKVNKDVIEVQYGNDVRIDIRKDKDGNLTAVRSYGLIAYPEEYKKIAEASGQFRSYSDDRQNALRMRDRTFQQYLHYGYIPDVVYPLTLGKPISVAEIEFDMDEGEVKYPVNNRSERSVSGDEYVFKFDSIYMGAGGDYKSPGSKPGIDVSAKGVEYLHMYYSGHDFFDNLRIEFKSDDVTMLRKYASAPETIYDRFETKYGAVSARPVQTEISGAYVCKGKIGPAKINGRIEFDAKNNTFKGEYGYGKRTDGITINGTIRNGGKITAYEQNTETGHLCGYYLGSLSNKVLSGDFQNYKGSKYKFNIELTPEGR